MPFTSIVMPYKENCKAEGEILTKFKIARLYFSDGETQKNIAANIISHGNTVNKIIKSCKDYASLEALRYLNATKNISFENLNALFDFLKYQSRAPNFNSRSANEEEKKVIFQNINGQ